MRTQGRNGSPVGAGVAIPAPSPVNCAPLRVQTHGSHASREGALNSAQRGKPTRHKSHSRALHFVRSRYLPANGPRSRRKITGGWGAVAWIVQQGSCGLAGSAAAPRGDDVEVGAARAGPWPARTAKYEPRRLSGITQSWNRDGQRRKFGRRSNPEMAAVEQAEAQAEIRKTLIDADDPVALRAEAQARRDDGEAAVARAQEALAAAEAEQERLAEEGEAFDAQAFALEEIERIAASRRGCHELMVQCYDEAAEMETEAERERTAAGEDLDRLDVLRGSLSEIPARSGCPRVSAARGRGRGGHRRHAGSPRGAGFARGHGGGPPRRRTASPGVGSRAS